METKTKLGIAVALLAGASTFAVAPIENGDILAGICLIGAILITLVKKEKHNDV